MSDQCKYCGALLGHARNCPELTKIARQHQRIATLEAENTQLREEVASFAAFKQCEASLVQTLDERDALAAENKQLREALEEICKHGNGNILNYEEIHQAAQQALAGKEAKDE